MPTTNMTLSVPVGRPLEDVLELCHAAGLAVMLRGGTGVGKSQSLQAFARKRGLEFVSRDLSLMEPPDLIGLPKLDGPVTRYLPPAFLPTAGEGILVLEEINRAPSYMRAPCLQLLTARCLNDYRLPDGWWVAAAINPAEDGYEAADLDPALASRFVQIAVAPDSKEWVRWARAHEVHPRVIAYVEADATVFDTPASNPRSWVHVAELLKASSSRNVLPALLQVAIAGCVGPERAAAFCRFLRDDLQPLKAHDIIVRFRTHRETVRAWVQAGQLDLVRGTLLNVQKRLQSTGAFSGVHASARGWANLGRFLSELPGDLREEAEAFFRERRYPVPGKKGEKQ